MRVIPVCLVCFLRVSVNGILCAPCIGIKYNAIRVRG